MDNPGNHLGQEGLTRTQSSPSIDKRLPGNEKDTESGPVLESEEHVSSGSLFYQRFRPYILAGVAAVIIGWWISATVLKTTRHRWCAFSSFSLLP